MGYGNGQFIFFFTPLLSKPKNDTRQEALEKPMVAWTLLFTGIYESWILEKEGDNKEILKDSR
jgi:hypothetical protein